MKKHHHHVSRENTKDWDDLEEVRGALFGLFQEEIRHEAKEDQTDLEETLVKQFVSLNNLVKQQSEDIKERNHHQASEQTEFASIREDAAPAGPEQIGNLENRIRNLENRLADYRWEIEQTIINRASDAGVHLNRLANQFRNGVKQELRRFSEECDSPLGQAFANSTHRRLLSKEKPSPDTHSSPE